MLQCVEFWLRDPHLHVILFALKEARRFLLAQLWISESNVFFKPAESDKPSDSRRAQQVLWVNILNRLEN